MKGAKKYWLWLLLLMLGLAGGMVYLLRPPPLNYQTVKAERRDLVQTIMAKGQLDAVRKVDVGAQVSGQLQKLYVTVGQQVKKGQLLALIDPQQAQNRVREVEATLEELAAQRTQTQAELKLAQLTRSRQQVLAKVQAISKQDLDSALMNLTVKQANLAAIDAQVKRNQATLESVLTELNYTRIIAPIDGEVVQVTTLEGQTVISAQQAPNILSLADMHLMLVKAEISEADVIRLKPGQKVWFTILGDAQIRFYGVLKDIQPTPEKYNNAVFYHARFEVPNEKKILRLDMTAQVTIVLEEEKQALLIPLAALGDKQEDNRYHVAVLKQGKEEQRLVTLGLRNNIDVQILSGLDEGDDVILSRVIVEDP